MKTKRIVSHVGCDCHRKFSKVTARDYEGNIVWRQRLDHADREKLREQLRSWPLGTPVVMEATFGWGWLCDEMRDAGLDPHLASSAKVAAWRKARGLAKSDRPYRRRFVVRTVDAAAEVVGGVAGAARSSQSTRVASVSHVAG